MNRDKFINELNKKKEKYKIFLEKKKDEEIKSNSHCPGSDTYITELHQISIKHLESFCDFILEDTQNWGDKA